MDLQRLKYFLEVARQKNFSKAADVCFVSQPSLSQQIKKLEGEVGDALFYRHKGKVTLTEVGEEFLKYAQAILANVQSAEEFIGRMQEDDKRTIRIGSIPTIAPYVIPELLSDIRNQFSAARFELFEDTTDKLVDSLLTGKVDFALMSPPTRIDSECDSKLLLEDKLLLTLPADHRLANSENISLDALSEDRVILLENSHCLATQAGSYCRKIGVSVDVDVRASQIDTLLGLVEQGFGLTFTPALAARANRSRSVVFRSMSDSSCSRQVRLMWLKRQFFTKSQRAVIEGVTDYCKRLGQNCVSL